MNEEKLLRIETNRAIYSLPVRVVAKDRADYYEKREAGCFKEEFDFVMGNEDECVDWIKNNMDWEDYKSELKEVEVVGVVEDFNNADMEFYD